MHFDETLCYGEPDSQSALGAIERARTLHEQVENMRKKLLGDTDSVVGDRDDGLFALLARFDPDLPARAGVLHRIHQDVRDTLNEASWVGVHEQRRIIRRDRQTVSLLADQRL